MNLIFKIHRFLCKFGIHSYYEYKDWSPGGDGTPSGSSDIWWYRSCPYCLKQQTLNPIAGKFEDMEDGKT
jgi:hypothetical protein